MYPYCAGDDSPVRYFKQQGSSNADTDDSEKSDFKSDDFLLVMQTPEQAEMMSTNQRIICVDATHGLTDYDYYLMSLLVVDKYGHGLVCATCIGSRENGGCHLETVRQISTSGSATKSTASYNVGRHELSLQRPQTSVGVTDPQVVMSLACHEKCQEKVSCLSRTISDQTEDKEDIQEEDKEADQTSGTEGIQEEEEE